VISALCVPGCWACAAAASRRSHCEAPPAPPRQTPARCLVLSAAAARADLQASSEQAERAHAWTCRLPQAPCRRWHCWCAAWRLLLPAPCASNVRGMHPAMAMPDMPLPGMLCPQQMRARQCRCRMHGSTHQQSRARCWPPALPHHAHHWQQMQGPSPAWGTAGVERIFLHAPRRRQSDQRCRDRARPTAARRCAAAAAHHHGPRPHPSEVKRRLACKVEDRQPAGHLHGGDVVGMGAFQASRHGGCWVNDDAQAVGARLQVLQDGQPPLPAQQQQQQQQQQQRRRPWGLRRRPDQQAPGCAAHAYAASTHM